MAEVRNVRRYYRAKAEYHRDAGEEGLYLAWRTKLLNSTGTPLPTDFPSVDRLAAHALPYTTYEDLDGADIAELSRVRGIGRRTAEAILAALEDRG